MLFEHESNLDHAVSDLEADPRTGKHFANSLTSKMEFTVEAENSLVILLCLCLAVCLAL